MKTKKKSVVDPYGKLEWCIGSENDFWCFDFHDHGNGWVTLGSAINSETGSFLQNVYGFPKTVRRAQAVEVAQALVGQALEWCCVNDVRHDIKSWNQDPSYFWRCVHVHFAKNGPAIRLPVNMARRPVITRNYL